MPSGLLRLRSLVAVLATLFVALQVALPAVAASVIAAVRVDAQPSGGALVTISFSGGAAAYHVVGAGTPETAIIFDGAQVGPQIPPTVAGTGPISSVSIAQTGTSSSVALHLTGVAGVRVRAAGGSVVIDVANPAGTTPAGAPAFGAPPATAAAVPASNTQTQIVLLKYADVSEIAGVLVAGSSVTTNDTSFRRRAMSVHRRSVAIRSAGREALGARACSNSRPSATSVVRVPAALVSRNVSTITSRSTVDSTPSFLRVPRISSIRCER